MFDYYKHLILPISLSFKFDASNGQGGKIDFLKYFSSVWKFTFVDAVIKWFCWFDLSEIITPFWYILEWPEYLICLVFFSETRNNWESRS